MHAEYRTTRRSPEPGAASRASIEACSDEELVVLAQGGDVRAFEHVLDRQSSAVFSLALRITHDRGAAEDVTQEVFLSIWRGGGRFRTEAGSARNWILMIARHRAIDALRRQAAQSRRLRPGVALEEVVEPGEGPEAVVALRERAQAVRAALSALPVELAYFVGLTRQEIVGLLELPVGTVKGRVRLGLGKLRPLAQGIAGQ